MKRYTNRLVVPVIVVLACTSARAAEWGTVKVRFVYDGKAPAKMKITPDKDVEVCGKHDLFNELLTVGEKGEVSGVVLYLRTEKPDVHPDYAKTANDEVVLDNHNCRFEPHVAAMRTTQTLLIKNSDPVGHNTKGDPLKNQAFNTIIPAGGSTKQKLPTEESLPVKIGCNIHPWMGGWVVVRSNPYAAVSDDKGELTIKDLPAGKELEFQLWQEKSGFLKDVQLMGAKADSKGRFKIKLKAGDNDLGEVKLSPKLFEK